MHPDLPKGWQGHTCLSHHLLPSRVHIFLKLRLKVELRDKSKDSDVGCGILRGKGLFFELVTAIQEKKIRQNIFPLQNVTIYGKNKIYENINEQ